MIESRLAAVIHLRIDRDQVKKEMEPAITEILAVLAEQGVPPAGPLFAHHLTQGNEVFDFEVGFPVNDSIEPKGRVKSSRLPGGKVAHTVHIGSYDDLFSAWREFGRWFKNNDTLCRNLKTGDTLFEIYSVGPETTNDSSKWRTDLYQTLRD